MIYVPVAPIAKLSDLQQQLQIAVELEHAIVPPYLTALYSLNPGSNDEIRDLLSGIVVEEMAHMALAANVLIAVGGAPIFDKPGFIPIYPGGLPFKLVDPDGHDVSLDLAPFSIDLVQTVFMRIEQSQNPIDYPGPHGPTVLGDKEYQTVGEFYHDISAALTAAGSGVITGDPAKQVTQFLNGVFTVTNLNDALRAIDTIVQQGEGTVSGPTSGGGQLAHYYQFAEISRGRTLVPGGPKGYSYSGRPIRHDRAEVLPLLTNPTSADYAAYPEAQRLSDHFNIQYSNLLRGLHRAFNGYPNTIQNAIGLMYDCKVAAGQLMQTPVGDLRAAPTYEYIAA